MSGPKCTVYRQRCNAHHCIHGGEAEELRSAIEKLIEEAHEDGDEFRISTGRLQRLLDSVDARDSLAFLEAGDRTRKGKKKAVSK